MTSDITGSHDQKMAVTEGEDRILRSDLIADGKSAATVQSLFMERVFHSGETDTGAGTAICHQR